MAVPGDDPNWDYQAGRPGQAAGNHMVACLIVGLQKAGHKAIFDKLREVTPGNLVTSRKPGTISGQVNGSPIKTHKMTPHVGPIKSSVLL